MRVTNVFFSHFKCTIRDLQVTAPGFGLSLCHNGFAEVAKARHSSNMFALLSPHRHIATLPH